MIAIYTHKFSGSLEEKEILKAIETKEKWNSDLTNLDGYYKGRNPAILGEDRNHKVPVAFGRKLVKSTLGFMFKEGCITYKFPDKDPNLKKQIDSIFELNDEETENIRIAKDQSLYGSGFEILFVDNPEATPEFYRIPARQIIPIYLPEIKPRMGAAINFYTINDSEHHIDVYYKDRIEKFAKVDDALTGKQTTFHQFGEVPVIEFRNNEEGQGDIECVIDLIDSHDNVLSNGVDEDGKFADALLFLKNMVLDEEQAAKIREKRIIDDAPEDAEASYLTKPNSYEGREVLRAKLEDLIYSMSGIPNLSDSDAMSQQSGEALKYLYATFEVMVAGDKQSGFTDGLTKRLKLICNYLNWLEGKDSPEVIGATEVATTIPEKYASKDISVNWKRNLPAEATTTIDNVVKASPFLSRRTILEQMEQAGIVEDVTQEETRLKGDEDLEANLNANMALASYGS